MFLLYYTELQEPSEMIPAVRGKNYMNYYIYLHGLIHMFTAIFIWTVESQRYIIFYLLMLNISAQSDLTSFILCVNKNKH